MDANELFSLRGRVALITGASSGLGARFAEVASAHGAKVVLVARRADRLEAVKQGIEATGGHVMAIAADVTDDEAMAAAFDAAEATFGTVDLFVANAGVATGGAPLEVTREAWRSVFEINLDAVFFGTQFAARRMIASNTSGSIITIASIAGLLVPLGLAAYGVAKAAVIQSTKLFAAELGKHDIRVNAIAPGWIMTEMSRSTLESPGGKEMMARTPLGRYGEPEDLDGAFLLLASNAGRLITGATIVVDSGHLL